MPLRPEVVPPTASDSFPHSTDQEEDQQHVFLHPPLLHQILVHVSLPHWSSLQRPKDVPGPHQSPPSRESAKLCLMPASQNFRYTPGTSQRSASPLLSAILPWRQKPATSLLGRLEDCHLPQSRSESLPSPPSPHLAPCHLI